MTPRLTRQSYSVRDTILYALGVGEGIDPRDLRSVYEKELEPLPTMPVVLAAPGPWYRESQFAIDWKKLLHTEQLLELHRPLPVEATVASEFRVDEILDKGHEVGALVRSSRTLYDDSTGDPLATLRQSLMLRGDGGFREQRDADPSRPPTPDRAPDAVLDLPTRPEQALIYRLSGDYNPLHCDPDVAGAAGFPRPILHGLCTYGIAARALSRTLAQSAARPLKRIQARFVKPVFPGETLRTQVWRADDMQYAFRCRVVERDTIVIDNGLAE